jgi:hypothetical protein
MSYRGVGAISMIDDEKPNIIIIMWIYLFVFHL